MQMPGAIAFLSLKYNTYHYYCRHDCIISTKTLHKRKQKNKKKKIAQVYYDDKI